QDLGVAAQDLAQVGRERVQVAQVQVGRLHAACPHALDSGGHGGVGGTPAHQEKLGVTGLVVDLHRREVGGDAGDLVAAQVDHALVVDTLVGDVAAPVGLLQAADAVLEARHAGGRPGSGQGVAVAHVGPEGRIALLVGVVRLRGEVGVD